MHYFLYQFKVWFQNARAKDKKSRSSRFNEDENLSQRSAVASPETKLNLSTNIHSQQSSLQQNSVPQQLDECKICCITGVNLQEHVFSSEHINQVKSLLETNSNLAISCLDNDYVSKNYESSSSTENMGEPNMSSAASMIGDLYNQIYQQKNRQLNAMSFDGSTQHSDQQKQQTKQLIDQNQLSLLSNNFLLKINANRQTITSPTNNEILHHRGFGQMSGKY